MANKEKKLEHIQVKDNGIKSSQKVGDTLNTAKQLLEKNIFDGLLKSANETSLVRFKIAQNVAFNDFKINTRSVIKNAKNEVKTGLEKDKTVNLTAKQIKNLTSEVNNGLLKLGNDAIKAYESTLRDITLNVKAAADLKEQIGKHLATGLDIGVVYKDGKKYKFDTYFEMKARTDIQQDIGKNMIAAGKDAGVIFYITSFYGDCAPDHADYQGKIYVDKDWEHLAPKDRLDEIRDYINSHKIMTVQEVTEDKPFLTTRPNCRHYFQYIDIDSVLGAKNQDDVKQLRAERDLNFNGKYKPDKYQALQQQRLNERKIRAEKREIQKQEQLLHLYPGDKEIQSKIKIGEANVKNIQAEQRSLIKQYDNLERRYDRESTKNRVDFQGGNTPQDFKFKSISKTAEKSKQLAIGFNEKNSDIYAQELTIRFNYHQYHDFEETPKFLYHRKNQSDISHIESRHAEILDKVPDYLERIPRIIESPEYLGKEKKDGSILVASSLDERSGLAVAISFKPYGIVVHSARYTSDKNWRKLIKQTKKIK